MNRTAMAPAPLTTVMSGTGTTFQKDIDSFHNPPPCKSTADAAEIKSAQLPKAFDLNSAKRAICFVGNFDEGLVQLVIDTWHLDHNSPISNAEELLTLVQDVAKMPEKQEELKVRKNQYLAEQKEAVSAKLKKQTDSYVPNVQNKDSANSEFTKTSAEMLKSVVSSEKVLKNKSPKETLKELTRRNQELKLRRMCRSCKVVELATSGITFLPCGHFITCEKCADDFEDCPCCGKNIMGTVRTYLS